MNNMKNMKNMKKVGVFLTILIMIVAVSALSGCISQKSDFIGTWKAEFSPGDYMIIVFSSDDTDTYTLTSYRNNIGASQTGYWEIISDKQIRVYNTDIDEQFELIHEYRFQDGNNKLHLGAFIFTKQ